MMTRMSLIVWIVVFSAIAELETFARDVVGNAPTQSLAFP